MAKVKKYSIFIQDNTSGERVWGNQMLDSYEEVQTIRNILNKAGMSVYDSEREVEEVLD